MGGVIQPPLGETTASTATQQKLPTLCETCGHEFQPHIPRANKPAKNGVWPCHIEGCTCSDWFR